MTAIICFIFMQCFIDIFCQHGFIYQNASDLNFCSFFNNRAPQPQTTLTNCTWFKKNSCCLQHEIDVSFSRVKPLIGATEDCQKYTNYLMCYICAPNQNEFYKKERLAVCENFCNLLYEFCKYATLKGNQIKQLYGSGKEFCLSRRFLVGQNKNCFSVSDLPKEVKNKGNGSEISLTVQFMIFLTYILCNISNACSILNKNFKSGFVMGRSNLLKICLLIMFLMGWLQYCKGNIIPFDKIKDSSTSLSSFIMEFADNSLKYSHYEEIIKSHSSRNKIKDSVTLNEIKTKLSNFFENRKRTVKEISKKIQDFYRKHAYNEGIVGSESFSVELLQFVKRHHTNEEIKNRSDSYAERTFFASRGGEYFVYPNQDLGNFEPRIQPWYLGVKEAPSNVILIMDSSYSHNSKSFQRTKEVVLLLLNSLAQHQRFAVISSASLTWDSSGKAHNVSATVLGCVKDRLIRATSGNVNMIEENIKNIDALGGSDHSGAFIKAFQLLKRQQSINQKYLECRSVILFISDGEQDEYLRCSTGYNQYTELNLRKYQPGELCQHDTNKLLDNIQRMQRSLPGAKANIFTFLTSHARKSDVSFCGKLACQNNGAFSRIYEKKNIFHQMSPFFDYIRSREYSYDPIITGPYKRQFDGAIVLTFSAPVLIKGSTSISGVAGIDVLFSMLENFLEKYHEYLYVLNLLDGSAIIHPLIKKSYEGMKEWLDAPLIDLEMEDSNHSKEFPEVVRMMMQRMSGEVIVRSKPSIGFEVEEGQALWMPTHSILHSFSFVPGSHFGFGIKSILSEDESDAPSLNVKQNSRYRLVDLESKNYHHSVFGSSLSPSNLFQELNITLTHPLYNRIPVSFQHSSVILTPPAFCRPSSKLSYRQLFNLQKYVNLTKDGYEEENILKQEDEDDDDVDDDDDDEDKDCLITERARQDIIMSSSLEQSWKDVRMIAGSIKSLYVATTNGVIRHFPGLQVPEGMIRSPLRNSWFIEAILNPDEIVVTNNDASFSGASNIITISRKIDSSYKAVLAVDILKDELRQKFLHSLDMCCSPSNFSCQVKCYLLSDRGRILMSLSGGLDRPINLRKQFPFVYKTLARHKLVVPVKTTELTKNCSNALRNTIKTQVRSCMSMKMETHVRGVDLDRMGGTFGRSSDGTPSEEPCHKGVFFLSSINRTNLFLLTLVDYSDDKYSPACINQIKNLRTTSDIQFTSLCPSHENYYISRTNSTTCPKKRFISLYCQYSSSAFAMLGGFKSFMSVLMFVFLFDHIIRLL